MAPPLPQTQRARKQPTSFIDDEASADDADGVDDIGVDGDSSMEAFIDE